MSYRLTGVLEENIIQFEKMLGEATDVKKQRMNLHGNRCYIAFIEVTVQGSTSKTSNIGRLLHYLEKDFTTQEERNLGLYENAMGIGDFALIQNAEETIASLLAGNAIAFVDGFSYAIKLPDKGYPGMDVFESDSEKVVRGSKESFNDSIKINTALIRKRLASSKLNVREMTIGKRSHSLVNLVYERDLVKPGLVEKIEKRLDAYEIDGIWDSGMLEQLAEEKWYSPFPQFQTTRRPDRAAQAILEGRVILLVNNSPIGLILPTDVNSFLKTSDDYYNRFAIATFARILRYVAAFFAMTLPGLYLALTNFHTQVLPTALLLSFWEARQGMPFPTVVEVLLMEISFELLREAGVRLPGAMGNTIGIVGGLIIGQSAVEASLVSPIVVILVAFTALCSFAIPNEEFAFSFRLLKFFFIVMCAWVGYYGFLIGVLVVLVHLTKLKSFGFPYLTPFVGAELNDDEDQKDAIVRFPLRMLWSRPIFARRSQRMKLKKRKK